MQKAAMGFSSGAPSSSAPGRGIDALQSVRGGRPPRTVRRWARARQALARLPRAIAGRSGPARRWDRTIAATVDQMVALAIARIGQTIEIGGSTGRSVVVEGLDDVVGSTHPGSQPARAHAGQPDRPHRGPPPRPGGGPGGGSGGHARSRPGGPTGDAWDVPLGDVSDQHADHRGDDREADRHHLQRRPAGRHHHPRGDGRDHPTDGLDADPDRRQRDDREPDPLSPRGRRFGAIVVRLHVQRPGTGGGRGHRRLLRR